MGRGYDMDYRQSIEDYIQEEVRVLQSLDRAEINETINLLEQNRKSSGKIYICGNGGSAATASHFVCDFNKGVSAGLEQKYNFVCLCDNLPLITAVANDLSYEESFSFQIEDKITEKDLLIGISGSGNSKNVVQAMEKANEAGAATIAICGYDGGEIKKLAKQSIHVRVDDMQICEDVHMILDHLMMWVLNKEKKESRERTGQAI